MTILITGGAGFIGSHFVKTWLKQDNEPVINIDKLSYAGNLNNIPASEMNHHFIKADIADQALMNRILHQYKPRAIVHFAAETHVDNSIDNDTPFIENNIVASHLLLKSVLDYWEKVSPDIKRRFRMIHISTDEVFGSLSLNSPLSKETDAYYPNNPYSATKAASDHLMRASYKTHGLPVIITHASNNYGPNQYPEKLIPFIIARAINNKTLPIYGDGQHSRDWMHVIDHCQGILSILKKGGIGESYNIGGQQEIKNIDLVHMVCRLLDNKIPRKDKQPYANQIQFTDDRKGHDLRYAMDCSKIKNELGFSSRIKIEEGLSDTIDWYLNIIKEGDMYKEEAYQRLIDTQYI